MEDTIEYDVEHLRTLGFPSHQRPSADELKKRWKDLCQKCHPDKGGDEAEFKKVTEAYEMMTNPEARNRKAKIDKVSLDFRIHLAISFEESIFGKILCLNYNVVEIGEDLAPIVKENIESCSVLVRVPPCTFNPVGITYEKMGFRRGEARGDAIVAVSPMPSKTYKVEPRAGFTGTTFVIVFDHPVPLHTMLKGGRVQVKTMVGIKTLRIPPGSREGQHLPVPCSLITGTSVTHEAVLKILYPTKKELKEGKEWKPLDIDWTEEDDEKPKAPFGQYFISFT